jgi:hypothetical protein
VELSSDQDTLLVAEPATAEEGGRERGFVHAVDLDTWQGRRIAFDVEAGELGSYSVAFADADRALVSTRARAAADVPLRRVRLTDGTVEVISGRRVAPDTMLAGSADGRVVAFAEGDSGAGQFGVFQNPSGPFLDGIAGRTVHEIGVSRTGTQVSVPTSLGLLIYDSTLTLTESLGGSGDAVLGVAYHPTIDRMYVAWAREVDGIEAYSAETFQKLSTIDAAANLAWASGDAFVRGRLRVARDGSFLLATTNDGIAVYPL